MRRAITALLSLLTGCGGGGGGGGGVAQLCTPIGGQVVSACTGCNLESGARAVDRNTDTAATLLLAPSAEGQVRGTGSVITSRVAGLLFDVPEGMTSLQLQINTYRGGVAQDSGTAYLQSGASNVCTNCSFFGDGRQFAGIDTVQPFDSIEVVFTSSSAALETPMPIYELCGR